MNEQQKAMLRADLKMPRALASLLAVLPMVPNAKDHATNQALMRVVRMTGIGFDSAEIAQVYYLLEEDGHIVRDGASPAPAARMECLHREGNPCLPCHMEIERRGMAAAVRYRIAEPTMAH